MTPTGGDGNGCRRDWRCRFSRSHLKIAAAVLLAVLLFVGGPGYHSPRSFGRFWNLGHIVLFFLLTDLFLQTRFYQKRAHSAGAIWGALAATLVLGALVELLQAGIGRLPAAGDVARDLLGTLLALAFGIKPAGGAVRWPQRFLQAAAVLTVAAACVPLAAALLDEYRAAAAFPRLASFETTTELDRWEGDAARTLSGKVFRDGRRSLKISLTRAKYSGVALKYFPRDWGGYDALEFSVFNPGPAPLALTCRVHDRLHSAAGQHYSDRFNRRFRIAPGWNDIAIPLEDIRLAPATRTLDLSRIDGLGLFSVRLPAPATVFLDRVRLVQGAANGVPAVSTGS
jgi:VanZ family protein